MLCSAAFGLVWSAAVLLRRFRSVLLEFRLVWSAPEAVFWTAEIDAEPSSGRPRSMLCFCRFRFFFQKKARTGHLVRPA
jgi:hypothetical protein